MSNSLKMYNGQSQLKSSETEGTKRKISTIHGLASIFGSQINKDAMKLWLSVLREFSATQVEEAGERLVKTEELVKMPAPATLIRHIKEIEGERVSRLVRIRTEEYKKFETAKKELKEKYKKKFDRIYDLCFSKSISGNEYKRRSDALSVEWRKEYDKIDAEQKSRMLELSSGKS